MIKALLLCLFALGLIAEGQEIFFKKCPSPRVVKNIDIKRYLGTWYENRKYFAFFQLGGRCTKATYSDAGSGLVKVENKQTNFFGKPNSVVGQAKLANPKNREGKLTVSFSSETPFTNRSSEVTDSNYWVLDTDYKSYSIVWSCTNAFILNAQLLWVLTRERQPSEALVNRTLAIIKERGLDTDRLSVTKQDGCK